MFFMINYRHYDVHKELWLRSSVRERAVLFYFFLKKWMVQLNVSGPSRLNKFVNDDKESNNLSSNCLNCFFIRVTLCCGAWTETRSSSRYPVEGVIGHGIAKQRETISDLCTRKLEKWWFVTPDWNRIKLSWR